MTNKHGMLRWFIWGLAAFFYFYEYLLRVSTSAMVPELMQTFGADAAIIGLMSAFYFFSYAPMQAPVGMLMDRFGAKKLLSIASLVCAIGIGVFGVAHHLWEAYMGRLLMGLGSSIAFVAMVFVCSHWFEKKRRALLVGLANSLGMLGAFCGQGPLSLTIKDFGWRESCIVLAIIGTVLAVVIYFVLGRRKETPNGLQKSQEGAPLFKGIIYLCKSKQTWLNAVITLLFYMTTTAVGGLWGVPFIQETYHVSKHIAGFATSMLFFGWLVGGPIMGAISDFLRNRKVVISSTIFLTLLSFLPVIYLTSMPLFAVYICMFATGFFSSGELLNFTLSTELNPKKYKGNAIAFTNLLVALGSSAVQPLIGFFIDLGWDGSTKNGVNVYQVSDYQNAFLILPIMLVVALILSFFLRETSSKESSLDSAHID